MGLSEACQTEIFATDIEKAPVACGGFALTGKGEVEFSISLKLSQPAFKSHADISGLL
jgi:hypothetical protein